jgi:hypothetical protein
VLQPIGDRQAKALITKAVRLFDEYLEGVDPRISHPQMYLPQKNPWIDSLLPTLKSQMR